MTIRRGFCVRTELEEDYQKINKEYGFSKFIALCIILFGSSKEFRQKVDKQLKKLLKISA